MATLDDIKAVLEGIRADLSGGAASPTAGMDPRDMEDYIEAVKEHTEALKSQAEATDAARQASDSLGNSSSNLGDAIAGTGGSFQNLTGKMSSALSAGNLLKSGFGMLMGAAGKLAGENLRLLNDLNKATTGIMAQKGATEEVAAAMGTTMDSMRQFGVVLRDVEKATERLMDRTFAFAKLSRDQQNELLQSSTLLEQLGVDFTDFADIVQVANKTFGMSLEDSTDMVFELRGAARDIGMPIDEFARKIPQLADNLASLGDEAFSTSVDIMKLHRETGLSTEAIDKLDSQMKTFEGAGQFAAKMNQLLGGTFFQPAELMQAYDEGAPAVVELVRSRFDQAGMDLGQMGRRAIEAMAAGTGIEASDFRKLVAGELGALDDDMGKHATSRAQAELEAQVTMKSTVDALHNMRMAAEQFPVGPIEEAMRGIQNETAQTAVNLSKMVEETQLAFVEAHKLELAYAAIAVNVAAEAKDSSIGTALLGGFTAAVGAAKTLGAKLTAPIGTMNVRMPAILLALYGMVDGIQKVNEAGGDFEDMWGAVSLGIMGAFGQTLEFITGGFIDTTLDALGVDYAGSFSLLNLFSEKTFSDSWNEIDWSFIGETFDFFEMEYKLSWSDIFNLDEWETIWIDTKEALEGYWDSFNNWWGRSSPSKRMQDAGSDIVAGLVGPFDNINAILEPITQSMIDIVPEPIQDLISGDTNFGAIAADTAAAASDTMSNIIDAVTGNDAQQQIQVSFQLDGREVDRKILKVVGGVVQPLTR